MLIEIFSFLAVMKIVPSPFFNVEELGVSCYLSWQAVRMPCIAITIHFGLTGSFFSNIFLLFIVFLLCQWYTLLLDPRKDRMGVTSLFLICRERENYYWTSAGSITLLLQLLGKLKSIDIRTGSVFSYTAIRFIAAYYLSFPIYEGVCFLCLLSSFHICTYLDVCLQQYLD